SGTWTNATQIAVAVYRNALTPVVSNHDDFSSNTGSGTNAILYRDLAPTTRLSSLGTGWFMAFATHLTATNVQLAPTGMTNVASSGGKIAVHDTNAPVSVDWTQKSVTVNASGDWVEYTVQVAARVDGTVSRVGAGAAAANTITIPSGHAVGDLILIFGFNGANASRVTLPSGYSNISNSSAISTAWRLGYKIATVSDTATTPVADFTGTPTSGAASLSVAFTDASTNTPTSWAWDFGDGSTSTSQNPTHSYSSSGV